jgi:DNA-directed RNA polymerase I subunit RPA49
MLYYLSCLLGFYHLGGGLSKLSAADIPGKFPGIPQVVLQGLLQRFAEPSGKRFMITETTKVKLTTWIATCYLACDGWNTDPAVVAKELKLPAAK